MISIVIPLYNKAQSIESTIRCIQAQTVTDFEIIVVEGWSTDGSLEIIQRLAGEDSRIKVLMQQDRRGITPARSESIAASSNEIIAFIDGDDYWEPDHLESLQRLINDYPECGIWGMGYGVQKDCQGGAVRESRTGTFRGIRENPWNDGLFYWTGSVAISKKAYTQIGGFDNSIIFGEDIDLWFRLMLNFPAAIDTTKVTAYYRVDAENRACNQTFKPAVDIPFHIAKYDGYRAHNTDFRKFFDLQMLYRLWPYAVSGKYRKDVKEALGHIDFSLQKLSMRTRFLFPKIYNLFKRS